MKEFRIQEKGLPRIEFKISLPDGEDFVKAFDKKFPEKEEEERPAEIISWYLEKGYYYAEVLIPIEDKQDFIRFALEYCLSKKLAYIQAFKKAVEKV